MTDPEPDPTPDLLAALRRLVDAVDPAIGRGDLEEYFKDPIRQARAAIARAEDIDTALKFAAAIEEQTNANPETPEEDN